MNAKPLKNWLVIAALMGFCSMGYEQALAFQISSLTGVPRVWETWSIAVFVLFMGIGAQLFDRSSRGAWRDIAGIEYVLSIAGIIVPAVNIAAALLYRIYIFENAQTAGISAAFVLGVACLPGVAAIGLLSGLELPYLFKNTELGKSPAGLLAIYYCGSLLGSLVFLAMKSLGLSIFPIMLLLAATNLAMYLAITRLEARPSTQSKQALAWISGVFLFFGIFGYEQLETLYLRAFYYHRTTITQDGSKYTSNRSGGLINHLVSAPTLPKVDRLHTAYQTVDFVPHRSKEYSQSMHINGRFQISSDSADSYHRPFASIPIEMLNRPKEVLILGGGDGALAHHIHELYPDVKITMVELDRKIITAANQLPFLVNINRGIFASGHVQVTIADAFNFLRMHRKTYDGIYIDVTYPFDFDSMRFYSLEFLRLIARSLSPDGYVVAGMAGDLQTDKNLSTIVKSTFEAAGLPHCYSFIGLSDWFVLATRRDIEAHESQQVPWQKLKDRFDPGLVHSLLKPRYISLRDPFH